MDEVAGENKKKLYPVITIDSFMSESRTQDNRGITRTALVDYGENCERISKFLSKILMVAIKEDCGHWVRNTNRIGFVSPTSP